MTWILAYLVIAGLFAMLGVSTGGFQRRDELAGDVATCLLWPAVVVLVIYARLHLWVTRRWFQ